jgi:hypothetical protein
MYGLATMNGSAAAFRDDLDTKDVRPALDSFAKLKKRSSMRIR